MGKVLNPLFSTEARNQIGQAVVYFPWKGINCVRTYVIPANPNTAAQQQQRGFVTDGVLQWRTLGYTADDKTAYNAWALIDPRIMSGFNKYMSLYLDTRVAGKTFSHPYNMQLQEPVGGTLKVIVYAKDDVADYTGKAYIDTAQGGTIYEIDLNWNAGESRYEGTKADLPEGVTYWVRARLYKANFDGWIGDGKRKL